MDKIWGIVRHVIGLAGGLFIGIGVADADQINAIMTNGDAIIGGVMAVVAVVASVAAKLKDFSFGSLLGKSDTGDK